MRSDRTTARPARALSRCVLAAAALAAAAPLAADVAVDSATFGGLRARSIGPAVMSGRIAAIDAVASDPLTVWVGAASGGVWKSTDAGITFKPVFDEHPQSIGAIRVDPQDAKTVWVGTGESWVRNSVSAGRGVFKTTDGGETWQDVGLHDTERIGAIRVHPKDSKTVWVCATGHLWDANEERGVFKTTDGGATWTKTLYVDADTGCADLDVDPQVPDVVYAGMWQFRRYPDFFESGGPGSGLHKSTDGGVTWTRLTKGLPEGELGRIAVAVSPSRPSTVYANVEAKKTGLYRSDDLGETWRKVNDSDNVRLRPFYFSELLVDPVDHERVYKPGFTLGVSDDGGTSFSSPFADMSFSVHPDHHALWINPENPHELFLGTDGGVYYSADRGAHWSHLKSLPVSQFYRVSVDLEEPYNVYGGLQDNGTWTAPSVSPGGVEGRDWDNIGFGDGFWAFADPADANVLYVEYQGGQLLRVNRALGIVKSVKPFPPAGGEDLRFNWNTPIHLSPNDPATLYYGSQYVHRSTDRGESWTTISPDLTTDDPERQRQKQSGGLSIDNSTAENNTTVFWISESPRDAATIWAGTDDGNLQVTRDGGATWSNVAANVGVPAGTWVSSVVASPHDAATAFATFDGHRTGDMTTYVHETTDGGATWRSLATDALAGWAHVVKQDPVNPDLLFLGTEEGLYVSLDRGVRWARFTENFPPVAVNDLVVHPRDHDLVIATHGRGVYILDDLTPLRALRKEMLEEDVVVLPSRPATMRLQAQLQDFSGGGYVGENPPDSAWIPYYLAKRHLFGDLKAEVYDADGKLITTLPGGKRRGVNRVEWPMRLKPPKVPPATALVPGFLGPRVPEGVYTVKLIKGKETYETTVELVADPRSPFSKEDRALQQTTALRLYDDLGNLTYLIDSILDARDALRERAAGLGERDRAAARLREVADDLETLRGTLVSTSEAGWLSGDEQLRERLGNLYGEVTMYDGRPTDSQLGRVEDLEAQLARATGRVDAAFADGVAEANRLLERKGLEPVERLTRDAWTARDAGTAGAVTARLLQTVAPGLLATLRAAFAH